MPTEMIHMGATKLQKDGAKDSCPHASNPEPSSSIAMPRARLPATPQCMTKRLAKRAVAIITSAAVAKAKLKPSSEKPARSISTRGAVEKKVKKAPMAALNPSV